MSMFWKLLEQSTLTTGVLAVCLTVTVCIMSVMSLPVPQELMTAEYIILAFFFGAKSQKQGVTHG